MRIQTNIMALNAYRNFGINAQMASKSLRRLSSGYRINSAADDAAGLAISEKMRGQIRGLEMAVTNTQNAVSLLQTAEGGLNEVHTMLTRMKELAVQSANGTYDNEVDRQALNLEYQALKDEINRVSSYTNYNGMKLLDGSLGGKKGANGMQELGITGISLGGTQEYSGSLHLNLTKNEDNTFTLALRAEDKVYTKKLTDMSDAVITLEDMTIITLTGTFADLKDGVISSITVKEQQLVTDKAVSRASSSRGIAFQIGANGSEDNRVYAAVDDTSAYMMGLGDTDILNPENARKAVDLVDGATNIVSRSRARLGAMQNRLEHTLNNLGTQIENLTAAESRIRDVDMAKEMMAYTKYNILMQAAQAMMSQAMNLPKQLLAMLQNL
ncbi:flagellin [Oscillospiraceae bacterium MB08-C2-2]|nr:flagellin [Oscillospiraceae bacterium MB08-C2-2]